MLWINDDTQQPMDEAAIREAHPLTVFPAIFAPPDGYTPVVSDAAPEYDSLTHALAWSEPALGEDGVWRRSAALVALPPDVAEANIEAARLARVPRVVSRAQGKVALIRAGLWPQVLAFVAAIPDPVERAVADVALNDTLEWRRDSAFLAQAAGALGLTARELDDLFVAAAEVVL